MLEGVKKKKKKNLVVFCLMTNLSYVCVGVREYYGHNLSLCLSVSLSVIVNKLFNVLTLIDTTKKNNSCESQ